MTTGLQIFDTVQKAIKAGYEIMSPHADSEGFLHARTMTPGGWALALIRTK